MCGLCEEDGGLRWRGDVRVRVLCGWANGVQRADRKVAGQGVLHLYPTHSRSPGTYSPRIRVCFDPPQPTTPSPPTSQVPYKYVDDLATIYCEWAEMEMRAKAYKKALALMRTATTPPQRPRTREVGTLGSWGGDAHWAPGSLAPGTRSPAVKSAWRPYDVAGFSCCPGSRNPQ